MAGSDDLKLKMMGLGGPPMGAGAAPAAGPEAAAGAGKKDAGYATFEGLIGDKAKYEAFVAQAKKTVAALEKLADKGPNPQAKADARKVLRAFDHALELLKRGYDMAQQIIKERTAKAQAKAKAGAKK